MKETSVDLLARKTFRAIERMNEDEWKQSKNLVVCFLSGMTEDRGWKGMKREEGHGRRDATSLYVDDFQHNVDNHSTAYH